MSDDEVLRLRAEIAELRRLLNKPMGRPDASQLHRSVSGVRRLSTSYRERPSSGLRHRSGAVRNRLTLVLRAAAVTTRPLPSWPGCSAMSRIPWRLADPARRRGLGPAGLSPRRSG